MCDGAMASTVTAVNLWLHCQHSTSVVTPTMHGAMASTSTISRTIYTAQTGCLSRRIFAFLHKTQKARCSSAIMVSTVVQRTLSANGSSFHAAAFPFHCFVTLDHSRPCRAVWLGVHCGDRLRVALQRRSSPGTCVFPTLIKEVKVIYALVCLKSEANPF